MSECAPTAFHGHFLTWCHQRNATTHYRRVDNSFSQSLFIYVSFVYWFKHECCEDLMKCSLFLVSFFFLLKILANVCRNKGAAERQNFQLVCKRPVVHLVLCSICSHNYFFNACSLLRLLECRFFIFNPACIARGVYKVAELLVVFEVSARLLYKPWWDALWKQNTIFFLNFTSIQAHVPSSVQLFVIHTEMDMSDSVSRQGFAKRLSW